ncbi:MGMT family protein [Thauera terpenica]|nr:MGMT family protein [Thauera terpenica]
MGSAIAANSLGFLVPCHRMIRADGNFGEYRWGSTRKQAMIVWEAHNLTLSAVGTSADGRAQRP